MKLNVIDEFLIRINPAKRQFKILTNIIFAKERELKSKFVKGLELLTSSYEIIMSSFNEWNALFQMLKRTWPIYYSQFISWNPPKSKNPAEKFSSLNHFGIIEQNALVTIDFSLDKILHNFWKRYIPKENTQFKINRKSFRISVTEHNL